MQVIIQSGFELPAGRMGEYILCGDLLAMWPAT
jgi:hypothetical protein